MAFSLMEVKDYFDGLVQDCGNSSALAMELLQSCTKPSIALELLQCISNGVTAILHKAIDLS